MQKVRIIAVVISNLILVFLFMVGFLTAFSLLPIKGNYKLMSVMSGSMHPTIKVGSLIVVKSIPVKNYKIGDIITFRPEGATKDNVTHRIVGIEQKEGTLFFKTKGDANDTPDQKLVAPNQIIGKELLAIPFMGYLLTYIKTLPGLIFFIFVPAIIIIAEEIVNIRKEIKRLARKRRKTNFLKNLLLLSSLKNKLKLYFQKRRKL